MARLGLPYFWSFVASLGAAINGLFRQSPTARASTEPVAVPQSGQEHPDCWNSSPCSSCNELRHEKQDLG